jgi:streptomycin 6-kinase
VFEEWVEQREGEAGRAWIQNLPATVDAYCARWSLAIDGPPMHGGLSLVVPVRRHVGRDDEPRALKIAWVDDSTAHEVAALRAWDGRGTVRLLLADEPAGAMLLERLDASRPLAGVRIGEATEIAASLVRRLSVPGPPGMPRLADVARGLTESIPERWKSLGRPIPRRLVDAARQNALALGPSAGSHLVNWDLHYENVLAGDREPWLAVDPKAVVGDPEYGLAQLLWTRLEEIEASGGLDRHFGALVEGACLDSARARAWSLVRCVDYCLWALGVGLTIDPVRCTRIAEWLLG